MRILNVDDNATKHATVKKVIQSVIPAKVCWEKSLVDAISCIQKSIDENDPISLIVSDMWYPVENGGRDNQSGLELIEKVKENGWDIPIIICSSVSYRIEDIAGCVHYSGSSNWEEELRNLLKQYK